MALAELDLVQGYLFISIVSNQICIVTTFLDFTILAHNSWGKVYTEAASACEVMVGGRRGKYGEHNPRLLLARRACPLVLHQSR